MKCLSCTSVLLIFLLVSSFHGYTSEYCSASYSFKLRNKTQLAQQAEQHFDLKANLVLKSAWLANQHNWWSLTIEQATIAIAGTEQQDPSYQHSFAFQLDNTGQITQFLFDPSLSEQTKNKLSGFAYYFQLPVKREAQNNYWLKDGIGKYQAKLTQQANSTALSKQFYDVSSMRDNSAITQIDVLYSEHNYVSSSCWYEQVSGNESLFFKATSDTLNMQSEQQYVLQQTQSHRLNESQLTLLERKSNAHQQTLSAHEKAALEKRFAQFLNQDFTKIDAFHLANLLQPYSQVLDVLHPLLAANQLSDASQMRLFNAIGQVDNQYSQVFLLSVLNKEYASANTQFRAIRALAQGHNPLSETAYKQIEARLQEGVVSTDDAMHGNFILALGTIIGAREPNDATKALSQLLHDQLKLSANETNQARVLTAMGNSQSDVYTETVLTYTNTQSEPLKNAAFKALGQIKSEAAEQRLTQALDEELSSKSAAIALNAIGNYQYKEEVKAKVLTYAKSAQSDDVRLAAINALGSQKTDKDTIKKELRSLLKHETSRRNFKAIVSILNEKDQ